MAAPPHLCQADDRDGQRLVLRRRVHRRSWGATSRSRRTRRPSGSRRSTGASRPEASSAGARRERSAHRDGLLYIMTGRDVRRPTRPPRWASSTRACRARSSASEVEALARDCSQEPRRAARREGRIQALPGDAVGRGRGLPLRQARAVAVPRREGGRAEGLEQFLDEKRIKPGWTPTCDRTKKKKGGGGGGGGGGGRRRRRLRKSRPA